MMGISYGGFTSLQVAFHRPPHLTSIIAVDFTDDRYRDECHYKGGLMRLYYNLAYYGGFMIAWNAMPPMPEVSGDRWAETWEEHLAKNEPYLLKWYRHQVDGPFWRHGSVGEEPERIQCPVFMIGGWRDGYINAPLRLYQKLNVPRKVLIGPWNHAMPDAAIPGPRVDYLPDVVRWLDHWCKGRSTGIMEEPSITVYMQESDQPVFDRLDTRGHWRSEIDWPPPGYTEKNLYPATDEKLATTIAENGVDLLNYEPTVGVYGGLFSGGIPFGLPVDQRPDEALSLTYTTPPLEEDIYVLGHPRAWLYVESSASVIGFVVSLSDISADGASHLVCKGALNATRRDSLTQPKLLKAGKIIQLEIEMDATGWVLKKGQRIRLSVSNGDWPNLWPTPEMARSRVYFGKDRPSRLVLPVVPIKGSAKPVKFTPSPMQINCLSDLPRPPIWEVCQDLLTGRTRVDMKLGGSIRLTKHTTIERESSGIFEIDPSDPAHATGHGNHTVAMHSGGQRIQARSEIFVQATAKHFHLTVNLIVEVNDSPYSSRRWTESIPRKML
jgi:putative CocE/NonD family hydrolase